MVKYLVAGTTIEDAYGYGSSGRISSVVDVKSSNCYPLGPGNQIGCVSPTFKFTYGNYYTGSVFAARLQSISSPTGGYSFSYATASLAPPFGADAAYSGVTTSQLVTLGVPTPGNYQFTYDAAGSQELTTVKFPYGGKLRWVYSTDSYASGRSLRAVTSRYLAADWQGATEWGPYSITRDSVVAANQHGSATLTDASGVGVKTWNFFTPGGSVPVWKQGLISEFIQKASAGGTVYSDETYTWTTNAGGHPYISAKTSVTDPGANQQSSLTTQTQDQFGNVTQQAIFPYNNTSTAVKTFNSTYLTDSAYVANYIRDRVVTVTLATGGTTKTLVQNYYDGKALGGVPASLPSNAPGLCGSRWGNLWQPAGTAPASAWDLNPPIAFSLRGAVSASVTPATTTCFTNYIFGPSTQSQSSNGAVQNSTVDATTNYSAPTAISTQSYGETISYNSWLGVTGTTGWNGEQLSMNYDGYGRPTSGTSAYGAVTNISYADSGQRQQVRTGPDGWTRTTLDGLGRVVKVERGQNASSIVSIVDMQYAPCACSPLGKLKQNSQPYAPGGTPVWTVYTYDGIGRTVSVTLPDGASTSTTSYLGNQTTTTDPAGKWKTFTSDVEGNLVTVTEPNPAGGNLVTNYTYDWLKHLTGVSMTRGSTTQTRSFVYDDQGHMTSATNPEGGTVSYYYNADNTLWYKHDAKGQDTVYTYDTKKRVTMLQRFPAGKSNAEDSCQRVTYTYDANLTGSTFSQYVQGRLAAVQYSACATGHTKAITERYNYHPAGAVTGKRLESAVCGTDWYGQYGCPTATADVVQTYDSKGAVATVQYPGFATPFVYGSDWAGRHVSLSQVVTQPTCWANVNTLLVQNGQFDVAGRLSSLDIRTGLVVTGATCTDAYDRETRSYNDMGQMTTLSWSTLPVSGGANTFPFDKTISYNFPAAGLNNGQVSSVSDGTGGSTVAYQYDAMKRLISAAASPNAGGPSAWTETYGMDGFGNLTSKVLNGATTSIAVDGATNRLVNASYDANGNMTSGAGASLVYDEANRLSQVSPVSGGTEYYGYAPDNKRVFRVKADGTEEWTLFGIGGEKMGTFTAGPVPVFDSGGNWTGQNGVFTAVKMNVWFDGRLVSEGTLTGSGSATVYNGVVVYQDRLGTNVAGGARFRPYGDEITSTANDRVKFGTYERSGFSGLDYADQRYFSAGLGRFNTADPYRASAGASDPGSWNRYSYVQGDPVNFNDPMGLEKCGFSMCVTDSISRIDIDPMFFTAVLNAGTSARSSASREMDLSGMLGHRDRYSVAELYGVGLALAGRVNGGDYTECDALGDYAGAAAFSATAGQFVSAFKNLVPDLGARTTAIGTVGTPVDLYRNSGENGFGSFYKNDIDDSPGGNGNQSHHFAAFLEWGYNFGFATGSAVSAAYELFTLNHGAVNQGDINLGMMAAKLGADLRSGDATVSSALGQIKSLCK